MTQEIALLIQAGATCALVLVTLVYVILTGKLVKASREGAEASESMMKATWESVQSMKRLAEETKTVAHETHGIAEQTNRSVEVMRAGLDLAHGTDLFAWQVTGWTSSGPVSVYRVHNTGKGAALNVVVHPLWGEWDPDAREGAGPIVLSSSLVPPVEMEYAGGPNRQFRLSVLPPESWAHLAVSGDETHGAVLGLRWDDPVRQVRRWRCWELLVRVSQRGKRIIERRRLQAPVANCGHCPEREHLRRCPREWRKEDEAQFDQEVAALCYGREDPLPQDEA